MNPRIEPARFLRRALMADGIVSGVSGVALLIAPGAIASLSGLTSPGLVAVVGVVLVFYGLALVRNARQEVLRRREATVPIALNAAWLLGTVVVVAEGWLSRYGNWTLLLVGDVVVAFVILEAIGLHKLAAHTAAGRRAEPA